MDEILSKISADSLLKASEKLGNSITRPEKSEQAPSFEEILEKLIKDVDVAQKEADMSIKNLVSNEPTSIHDMVLKMEEADLTFKLMKEVRDKLVSAYKETITM